MATKRKTTGKAMGKTTGNEAIEAQKAKIVRRLKRLEGQIRGLQRMIDEDAPCEQVLIQFSAVRAAFESAGVNILSQAMRDCIFEESPKGLPREAVDRAIKMFEKYACHLR